jgi:hypothetical protein
MRGGKENSPPKTPKTLKRPVIGVFSVFGGEIDLTAEDTETAVVPSRCLHCLRWFPNPSCRLDVFRAFGGFNHVKAFHAFIAVAPYKFGVCGC